MELINGKIVNPHPFITPNIDDINDLFSQKPSPIKIMAQDLHMKNS